MSEMNIPLINQDEDKRDSSSHSYVIKKEELSDLFQFDNIRDGSSLQKVLKLGSIDGVLKALNTDLEQGITSQSIQERIQAYGQNERIEKVPKTFFELVVECLEDDTLRLLCAASFVSLVIGCIREGLAEGWIDGIGIFIAVFIIVTITSVNNYVKEKQFRNLNQIVAQRSVAVIRNGQIVYISIYSLLVGDIMIFEAGEVFPVDGILVKGNNLVCDESSITGESDPIKKQSILQQDCNPAPFLISGSQVTEGSGAMIVLAVGQWSTIGKQQALMNEEEEEEKRTPLQYKLDVFVDQLGSIGVKWAFLTFFVMFANLMYTIYSSNDPNVKLFSIDTLSEILDYFIVGITVVVIAVPEGLPLAVTLSLAYAVSRMMRENNLVRNLISCEIMGGADTICSDKTGTLTENQMKVKKLYALGQTYSDFERQQFDSKFLNLLTEGICVNSNAHISYDKYGITQNGNKTECALLELAMDLNVSYTDYRPSDNIIKIIPFSSARKRMSTVYIPKDNTNVVRVYSKGGPEIMLQYCNRYMTKNGQVEQIDQSFLNHLLEVQNQFSNDCLRTLLLTYNELPSLKANELPSEEELEKNLIILAMIGIQDPLRKGISKSVAVCTQAGVTVRMVTGDNLNTAVAIAKEAGIISSDYVPRANDYTVMEGKQFREKVGGLQQVKGDNGQVVRYEVGNLQAFREVSKQLRVLARSAPEDKFLLVTGLQKCDSIVAVTGDGTNDAPALKKADIGFAMGITGTEVAKEAAGILLLDDNFSSTITAIKWGRNIFECIRKFLCFQLTINVVALFMAFLGGATVRESPLNTIQILWVNLMQDTMAALALATEPPSEELLKRKPVKRTEVVVTPSMWKFILLQSIYQIFILIIVLFYGDLLFGVEYGINNKSWTEQNGIHLTMFFNIFVFLSVFNEVNCRKLKASEVNVFENFFNNPLFIFIIVSTIGIQMLMVEYGGRAAKCSPLTLQQNLICIAIGASSVAAGILIKLLPSSVDDFLSCTNPFKERTQAVEEEPQGDQKKIQ
ncbi:hypothetical protein ABPG72_013886 [Tetrahymena utriculariae]